MVFTFLILLLTFGITRAEFNEQFYDIKNDNWTSCEEFLNNTIFDPKSVIDTDWKIFYFWYYEFEESYQIRFSIPSPVLIDRFKAELNNELSPPVNWSDADLFVETSIDLSGLMIKTDISGMYRLIPSLSFQYTSTPLLTFGLKVVDGYLGMMNCKHRFAYALSPIQLVPNATEIDEAAAKIGYWSPFGRSYLVRYKVTTLASTDVEVMDDADEDEQIDVDRDMYNLQVI